MDKSLKRNLIESFRRKYHRATKKKKGEIIDLFCVEFGYHRKHAIRVLRVEDKAPNHSRSAESRRAGRPCEYDAQDFERTLRRVWKLTDFMGSKALHEAIPLWLPFYEKRFGDLDPVLREHLIQVSPATIDRCLKPHKITFGKGRGGTKPGSILRTEIPIRAGVWDETIPGYMEIDTVAHCGGSLMGDFVWTLTLTDINTTWTENRALWGKGASGVLDAIKDVETYLPFRLLGADCDNGSEFINHHLMRYFSSKPKTRHGYFQFTRSRPYHKGDNAHVEQKNYTHARQVLGYERLGFLDLVEPINELYRMISLLRNHFNPSFKLKEKQLVNGKHRRKYGKPKTPYERILESRAVPDSDKEQLIQLNSTLDPITLQTRIRKKQKEVFTLLKSLKETQERKRRSA